VALIKINNMLYLKNCITINNDWHFVKVASTFFLFKLCSYLNAECKQSVEKYDLLEGKHNLGNRGTTSSLINGLFMA
jgi:hypothetical protein